MGNKVMKNSIKNFGMYIGAILLAASLLEGCGNKGVPEEELVSKDSFEGQYLVTADYVKEHAGDENVILVDCRGADKAKREAAEREREEKTAKLLQEERNRNEASHRSLYELIMVHFLCILAQSCT